MQKILAVLLFLLGFFAVLGLRARYAIFHQLPFIPQSSNFKFQPPAQALKGKISQIVGEVKILQRGKKEYQAIGSNKTILQGESIKAEDGNSILNFPNMQVSLYPDSNIAFINTLPENFLVVQTEGSASYTLLRNQKPVSIRVFHSLYQIDQGSSQIKIETKLFQDGAKSNVITIGVISGRGKLAMVNKDNKTHIWDLSKGDKALVDEGEREVSVVNLSQ